MSRTPDDPIPQTITTSESTFTWAHQMDYYKNGMLHYYAEDPTKSVKHANSYWKFSGMRTDEVCEFLEGYKQGRIPTGDGE